MDEDIIVFRVIKELSTLKYIYEDTIAGAFRYVASLYGYEMDDPIDGFRVRVIAQVRKYYQYEIGRARSQ